MLAMLSGRLPPRLGEGLLTEGTTCLVTARPLVWRVVGATACIKVLLLVFGVV